MNLPAAVKSCFAKYAIFDGRASRSEYWYFQLFVHVVLAVLVVLVPIVPDMATAVGVAGCVFYLFIWLPSLAAAVRRLHDRNRSGWHYLWVLVPFGAIAVLIWLCQEGIEGDNRFGPDPLAAQ
ncbi:MAG: DUF805 domain-containing protein [Reyranella sp.]|uniref:DUF805 domain-containing protein n=1 Tax=Reyranella sp. TaxID=1929291 RepID=UPI0011F8FCA6|nr:DUF805 domain-containing protein [Reyranella sp.]TAJ35469.1 MAG: DUF805 domain-containing protein [Reyranella sp.]